MSLEATQEQDLLQRQWDAGRVLHVNGIVFGSGRVLLFSGGTVRSGTSVRAVAAPLADTSVASILKYGDDPWVQVTQLASLDWSSDVRIACGEGAMGNEGYVAAVNRVEGSLIWVLFSTCSNPFISAARDGEEIVVEGGYDQVWRIPFEMPENLVIE